MGLIGGRFSLDKILEDNDIDYEDLDKEEKVEKAREIFYQD